METQQILLIAFALIYLISSLYAQRFQYVTRSFSMYFSNGLTNPAIQKKVTPNYVGLMILINGFLLLSIAFLLWHTLPWYKILIVLIILFFSSSILQMVIPFPSNKNIYSQMLNEAMKGNKIENLRYVNRLMEILDK